MAVLMVAGVLLSACGGGGTSAAAAAKTMYAQALKNATLSGWVHETIRESGPGNLVTMDNEIGASSGTRTIVSNGAHATIIFVAGKAYLQGDLKAIVHYFEFPTKKPQTLVNRWIGIGATDPGYASLKSTVTLAGDFGGLSLKSKVTKGAAVVIDGQTVIPLSGELKGSNGSPIDLILYVTSSGKLLPVGLHVTSGQFVTDVEWDNWGQGVTVVAPSTSIPITKVLG